MKEKYISDIISMLKSLNENQLLYLFTFIRQMFGRD